jgi:hypothetical protein
MPRPWRRNRWPHTRSNLARIDRSSHGHCRLGSRSPAAGLWLRACHDLLLSRGTLGEQMMGLVAPAVTFPSLTALDRAESLAQAVARDGDTAVSKGGLPKVHPGIREKMNCRAFVCRLLERLGLNVEAIRPKAVPCGHLVGRHWHDRNETHPNPDRRACGVIGDVRDRASRLRQSINHCPVETSGWPRPDSNRDARKPGCRS